MLFAYIRQLYQIYCSMQGGHHLDDMAAYLILTQNKARSSYLKGETSLSIASNAILHVVAVIGAT